MKIPLRNRAGEVVAWALVDDDDEPIVADRRWYLGSGGYPESGNPVVRMHRLLAVPAVGMVVDHINGDKLDNRRRNLRVVTQAVNCSNLAAVSARGYRGVYLDRRDGAWYGQVKHKGRKYLTGRFPTAEAAAAAVVALRGSVLKDDVRGRQLSQ